MENSANALKIAVSIFVFIIALTMVFALVTKIKDVADRVFFYSDKTNYYTYTEGTKDGTNGRIVGNDTVESAIRNRESDTVIIVKKAGNITEYSDTKNTAGFLKLSGQTFTEQVFSVKTTGRYILASDGTNVEIQKGESITYIIYTSR